MPEDGGREGLHVVLGDDAVPQPVGQQLAGDTQRRAVLHEGDVVDVGHLGAADALVDPAHHVAEDRLAVVVDLFVDLLGCPGQFLGQRDGQQFGAGGALLAGQLFLDLANVDLVVVHGVQGGTRRRRHPRGGGAGLRLGDLLLDHLGHQIGHGPHALTDLGASGQAVGQTGVDVGVLVGLDPRLALQRIC